MSLIACVVTSSASAQEGSRAVIVEASEGTKLAFDLSPDGRTIVMDLLGQLWTMAVEGGVATAVTDAVRDSSDDRDPVFSADGSIIFRADRPGGAGLFQLNPADGSVRRLVSGSFEGASVAPNGARIAASDGQSIHLVDLVSGESTALAVDSMPRPMVSHPTWSPRDGQLVFVNAYQGARFGSTLWEVSADGGVATMLADSSLRARAPAYSPDGRHLAFFSPDSANRQQVWIVDGVGEPRQLTDHEDVTALRVRWFPEGDRLLYHADGRLFTVAVAGGPPIEIPFTGRLEFSRNSRVPRPLQFSPPGVDRPARGHQGLALAPGGTRIAMIALAQLWVMDVGAAPRSVAPMPPTAAGLAWSPDERAVIWSAGSGGAEDLYATDLVNGRTRQITALPGSETGPSWSPDGRHIAFVHWAKPAATTDPWDYSDANEVLRVVSADGPVVASIDATRDLGGGFSTLGFFGPNQEAPMWSPDSAPTVAFFNAGSLVLASLSGERTEVPVALAPTYATWSAGRGLVYVEDAQVWRAALDVAAGTTGEPKRISDDAALYASAAHDGTVLYVAPDGLRMIRPGGQVDRIGWPLTYRTATEPPMLLRNLRLLDGGAENTNATVDILMEAGRIASIGAAGTVAVGPGTTTIDGAGRIAIPGLIDLHTHLWDDAALPAALYYGVTTIRDMGASGVARLAAHRDAIEAGVTPGPRVVMGGVQFWGKGKTTHGGGWEVSDDAARARAMALAGVFGTDHIKMRWFSDWAEGAKLIDAAHRSGWTTSGHVALPLPFVAAGIDGMEHLGPSGIRTNEILYGDMVSLFAAAGIWVNPTIIAYSSSVRVMDDPTILDEPETHDFVTPFLRWWALRLRPGARDAYARFAEVARTGARRLRAGGVTLGAGSDAPFLPWALHAELEELVAAGLSPMEAITTATRTAAGILGASVEIGAIEEGRRADLVILDADPREDIRHTREIWMVIKEGATVDRAALRDVVASPMMAVGTKAP
jgi:Tol biopolymer transport system component/cytosine/adenosine deaminase-related metal-dependent hydrolase